MSRNFPARQIVLSLAVVLITFIGSVAQAFQKPSRAELEDFDARKASRQEKTVAPGRQQAATQLRATIPGAKVEWDEVLGTPRVLASLNGFLTGPDGSGGGVSKSTLATVPSSDPLRTLKAFVQEHAGVFGHDTNVFATTRVTRDFTTKHNGLRTVVLQQELNGISVFQSVMISHVSKHGELVQISSRLLPDVAAAALAGTPNQKRLVSNPMISAAQAASTAANLVEESSTAADFSVVAAPTGAEQRCQYSASVLKEPARLKLVWAPLSRERMRLGWEVILTGRTRGERYRVIVDAETGAALLRHCLTSYLSDATYRVYTSDSPTPMSPGLSTPSSTQPSEVPRDLVVTPALNTDASPNGWINDGDNETRGNNVDAHADADGNNQPDLPRPQGSPNRVFDFPINLSLAPSGYREASVVQLFYWCNWMHDKLYELGFTEAAGNFQNSNFGRGGVGGDAVLADAQDGSDVNNAGFSVDDDGSPGRMEMYLFNGPSPDRDGSLDAEIVLHEYTHGLSNRRVGSGQGLLASQSRGMGEGWSDFYALALLSESTDDIHANYAMGGYATLNFFGLAENYYYGIRRYPYSTEMTKNPLTFKDIDPSQADSHPGIPKSPVIGGSASEVHSQGEVWCSMLWEMRANLITVLGFADGNHLALQLVTDGMGLSPSNPSFVEARDGILQADQVLTGGTNRTLIWSAFAKRGLGFHAIAPSSSTAFGVTEDFSLPDDLGVSPSANFVFSGAVGGPFFPASRTITLVNSGAASLNWSALVDARLTLSSTSGTLNSGENTSVMVSTSALASNLAAGVYTTDVVFSNLSSGFAQTNHGNLRVGQRDNYTVVFDNNDFNLQNTAITYTPDGSTNFYRVCRQPANAFPTDPVNSTAVTLGDDTYLPVSLTGGKELSIYGQHSGNFYIGANGHLTLTSGNANFFHEELSVYFERVRISALYTDLDPSSGGSVSWNQLNDRVIVTYQDVPEYFFNNQNSFQFEVFFNGVIRITWLNIAAANAVAGLSDGGGVPANFVETDPSTYPTCSSGAPLLNFSRTGSNLKLTWPIAVPIFRLESTTNLVSPSSWSSVTNAVQLTNGLNTVTVPMTRNQSFFRLVTP